MCIAIPGQIISMNGNHAVVNIMGVETVVNIQLVAGVKVGDHVLIHAGCAIETIHDEYARFLEETYSSYLNEDGM